MIFILNFQSHVFKGKEKNMMKEQRRNQANIRKQQGSTSMNSNM